MTDMTVQTAVVPLCDAGDSAVRAEQRTSNPRVRSSQPCAPQIFVLPCQRHRAEGDGERQAGLDITPEVTTSPRFRSAPVARLSAIFMPDTA